MSNYLLIPELLTAVNPTVGKIPPELVNDYLQDYYNELRKSKLWTIKPLENGEEDAKMRMIYIVMYGKKPE